MWCRYLFLISWVFCLCGVILLYPLSSHAVLFSIADDEVLALIKQGENLKQEAEAPGNEAFKGHGYYQAYDFYKTQLTTKKELLDQARVETSPGHYESARRVILKKMAFLAVQEESTREIEGNAAHFLQELLPAVEFQPLSAVADRARPYLPTRHGFEFFHTMALVAFERADFLNALLLWQEAKDLSPVYAILGEEEQKRYDARLAFCEQKASVKEQGEGLELWEKFLPNLKAPTEDFDMRSDPLVTPDHIFILAAAMGGTELSLHIFDRETGEHLRGQFVASRSDGWLHSVKGYFRKYGMKVTTDVLPYTLLLEQGRIKLMTEETWNEISLDGHLVSTTQVSGITDKFFLVDYGIRSFSHYIPWVISRDLCDERYPGSPFGRLGILAEAILVRLLRINPGDHYYEKEALICLLGRISNGTSLGTAALLDQLEGPEDARRWKNVDILRALIRRQAIGRESEAKELFMQAFINLEYPDKLLTPVVRSEVAEMLIEVYGAADLQLLISLFGEGNDYVANRALCKLFARVWIESPEQQRLFGPVLEKKIRSAHQKRWGDLSLCIAMKLSSSGYSLARYLEDPDPKVRFRAAIVLAHSGSERAVAILQAASPSPLESQILEAINIANYQREVRKAVTTLNDKTKSFEVRSNAILLLGRFLFEESILTLRRVIEDSHEDIEIRKDALLVFCDVERWPEWPLPLEIYAQQCIELYLQKPLINGSEIIRSALKKVYGSVSRYMQRRIDDALSR